MQKTMMIPSRLHHTEFLKKNELRRVGVDLVMLLLTQKDSIEHYARCIVTLNLSLQFVGLPATHYSHWLGNFVALGLNHCSCDDVTLTKRAAIVYAVYMTTNHIRHHPTDNAQFIMDMAQQHVREAVRGHPKATANLEKHIQVPGNAPGV